MTRDLESSIYTSIFLSISEGIIVVDKQAIIQLINSSALGIFGYNNSGELLGKSIQNLIPIEKRTIHREHMDRYFTEPLSRPMGAEIDLEGLRKDGTHFPVAISLDPININSEMFIAAIVVDITSRKLLEDALKERMNDLRSFSYYLAHDIQNIATSIQGSSEIIKESIHTNDPELHSIIDLQITRAAKLSSIVSGILSLVNPDGKRLESSMIHVRDIVDSLNFRLRDRNGMKGTIILEEDFSIDSVRILIEELFYNICTNGLKYNDSDNPEIRIRPLQPGQEGYIRFRIDDNGMGMEDETIELFQTDDASISRSSTRGYGIGTHIINKILQRLNGHLKIESGKGEGSKFTISLPVPS